jgi:hypothetical protein
LLQGVRYPQTTSIGVGPAQLCGEIVQQIKNPRVVVTNAAGAVVAQVVIEVIKCFGNVSIVLAINDI